MKNDPKYIIIHCTDCPYRVIQNQYIACNQWHKDRNFPISSLGQYIGYHCLITDGINYKCRLETDEGAHCNQGFDGKTVYQPGQKPAGVLSMNFQSLGIAIGFDGDSEMPTNPDYVLLQKQVWAWQDFYNIPNERVYFHRFFAPKTCPGKLITDQWLKDLLTRPLPIEKKSSASLCMTQSTVVQTEHVSFFQRILDFIKRFY